MGQATPMELTQIKKIVVEIQKFPAKIDSTEQAKNVRRILKKYAVLSEKIERNVLISVDDQKDLAKIRTKEFRALRKTLKEKANAMLHAKSAKSVQSEKPAKTTAKTTAKTPTAPKKPKAVSKPVAKETKAKTPVKKATAAKPKKAAAPKE